MIHCAASLLDVTGSGKKKWLFETDAGAIGFAIGTGMEVTFVEIFMQKIATRGLILLWQSVAIAAACIVFVVLFASWLSIRRVLRLEAATVFRS